MKSLGYQVAFTPDSADTNPPKSIMGYLNAGYDAVQDPSTVAWSRVWSDAERSKSTSFLWLKASIHSSEVIIIDAWNSEVFKTIIFPEIISNSPR